MSSDGEGFQMLASFAFKMSLQLIQVARLEVTVFKEVALSSSSETFWVSFLVNYQL